MSAIASPKITLLLIEKKLVAKRDDKGKYIEPFEEQGFLTFDPNYYNFPVSAEVFDKVRIGRSYQIDMVEVEA